MPWVRKWRAVGIGACLRLEEQLMLFVAFNVPQLPSCQLHLMAATMLIPGRISLT